MLLPAQPPQAGHRQSCCRLCCGLTFSVCSECSHGVVAAVVQMSPVSCSCLWTPPCLICRSSRLARSSRCACRARRVARCKALWAATNSGLPRCLRARLSVARRTRRWQRCAMWAATWAAYPSAAGAGWANACALACCCYHRATLSRHMLYLCRAGGTPWRRTFHTLLPPCTRTEAAACCTPRRCPLLPCHRLLAPA